MAQYIWGGKNNFTPERIKINMIEYEKWTQIRAKTISMVNSGAIKKHPTKRFIIHLDGNISNWNIDNLGWTNMNKYMHSNQIAQNTNTKQASERAKQYFSEIEERIRKGNIILCKNL